MPATAEARRASAVVGKGAKAMTRPSRLSAAAVVISLPMLIALSPGSLRGTTLDELPVCGSVGAEGPTRFGSGDSTAGAGSQADEEGDVLATGGEPVPGGCSFPIGQPPPPPFPEPFVRRLMASGWYSWADPSGDQRDVVGAPAQQPDTRTDIEDVWWRVDELTRRDLRLLKRLRPPGSASAFWTHDTGLEPGSILVVGIRTSEHALTAASGTRAFVASTTPADERPIHLVVGSDSDGDPANDWPARPTHPNDPYQGLDLYTAVSISGGSGRVGTFRFGGAEETRSFESGAAFADPTEPIVWFVLPANEVPRDLRVFSSSGETGAAIYDVASGPGARLARLRADGHLPGLLACASITDIDAPASIDGVDYTATIEVTLGSRLLASLPSGGLTVALGLGSGPSRDEMTETRFDVPAVVRPDADAVSFVVGTATTGRHWISSLDLGGADVNGDGVVDGDDDAHLSGTYDELRRIAGVTFEISPERAGPLAGDPLCGRVPVDPSVVQALERMAAAPAPSVFGFTDAQVETRSSASPDGLVARVIYIDREAEQAVAGLIIGTTRHTREEWNRDIVAPMDCSLTPHQGVGDAALLRECSDPARVAIHLFVESIGLSATAFAQATPGSDGGPGDLVPIAEAIAREYLQAVCQECPSGR